MIGTTWNLPRRIGLALILGVAIFGMDTASHADDSSSTRAARLTYLQGTVTVYTPDSSAGIAAQLNLPLLSGVQVVTGQTVVNESTSSVDQALSFFSTALLVFAFISLFVGGFTIFNTFSIIVGQRTRELALLRIVGASRRQVFRSVLGEAAITGLVGSLVGLGLGVLLAAIVYAYAVASVTEFRTDTVRGWAEERLLGRAQPPVGVPERL